MIWSFDQKALMQTCLQHITWLWRIDPFRWTKNCHYIIPSRKVFWGNTRFDFYTTKEWNGHAIKSTARHFVAKHIHKTYSLDIFTWIVWNMSFLNFIHKQCYYVDILIWGNRFNINTIYLFIVNCIISLVTRSCIIHKQIKKFRWALSCAYAKFVFNFELYSYQKKMKWKCLNFE